MAKKKVSHLSVPRGLSEELSSFMKKEKASRGAVVKALWEHIKKHKLNEGKIIHPDKHLAPILGKKPIDMFKMMKVLNDHIESNPRLDGV